MAAFGKSVNESSGSPLSGRIWLCSPVGSLGANTNPLAPFHFQNCFLILAPNSFEHLSYQEAAHTAGCTHLHRAAPGAGCPLVCRALASPFNQGLPDPALKVSVWAMGTSSTAGGVDEEELGQKPDMLLISSTETLTFLN